MYTPRIGESFIRGAMAAPLLFLCVLFITSCGNDGQPRVNGQIRSISKDSLINYNRKIVKSEDQEIEDYIGRHQLKMEKTSTGLRYLIYVHGNGPAVTKGKRVTLKYSVRLITGDLLYSSEGGNPMEFETGHGGVESGLEEGIFLLHTGDHAKFIVPSHLAFGLLGDQDKIPQQATLVYDIELVKLK
jgi:FKBP-type peptidyl-prolyl cis-trans isomerase FkpA